MSIENITANILKDATKSADDAVNAAKKSAEDIINKAKEEAAEIIKASAEKAQKDAESLKSRKVSAAELQMRKMMLQAKQDAIKNSFNTALEKLKNMPEEKYINYLAEEIIKVPNNSGTIILNKKDKEKIGEKLIKLVNEKLNAEKFTLSNNTVNSSGGFVLKSGNVEINNTFEAILDSMKDELTNEVAGALFK